MPEDVTLDSVAAVDTAQPTDQAVQGDVQTAETPGTTEQAVQAESPTVPGKTYAGKYNSDVELERGYVNLTAEASRMAQELARYKGQEEVRGQSAPATSTNPLAQYSSDVLENHKEQCLLNLSKAQTDGEGDKAAQYAKAIRDTDKELRRRDIEGVTQGLERKSATSELDGEIAPILDQYKADLADQNSALYQKAQAIYNKAVKGGASPGNYTLGSAIVLAAQLTGKASVGVAQARKDVSTNIQQSFKQAVAAGAGKATTSAAQPDFMAMTDKDFVAWKAERGWN